MTHYANTLGNYALNTALRERDEVQAKYEAALRDALRNYDHVNLTRAAARRLLAMKDAEITRLEAEVAALCVPRVVERTVEALNEAPSLSEAEQALWDRPAFVDRTWRGGHAEQYAALGNPFAPDGAA